MGVDAGGTWVRVRALADARPVASVAHPARAVPELATFLHNLWRRRGWTRARVDALVVASRGVWLPRERRALRRRLSGLARRVNVIADVEAAWHATLGAERGVLVLAGTGSIALGRDARGRWARAGGLGPLLGDEGSAFWIGREWLRATADERARRRFATAPQLPRPWRVPGGRAGALAVTVPPALFALGAMATAGWGNTLAGLAAALSGPLVWWLARRAGSRR